MSAPERRRTPHRPLTSLATLATAALVLSACGSEPDSAGAAATSSAGSASTVQVTDLHGDVTVPAKAQRVVLADNRAFRIADDWGVDLVAAPVDLMPKGLSYTTDKNVQNIGTHREPNLELLVSTRPDLVVLGQRFADQYEPVKKLVGDTPVVDTNLKENADLPTELKRHSTLLGKLFQHEQDATRLNQALDAAIAKAKGAYSKDQTVMGLITSGTDISYAAPSTGRSVGPFFPMLGLTPALQQTGKDNSHGDDISVEAIAKADPDWLIVLDRDAATGDGKVKSAKELITTSPALKNVTAVKRGNIFVLPDNFYVAEDIKNYTDSLNRLAAAFAAKRASDS